MELKKQLQQIVDEKLAEIRKEIKRLEKRMNEFDEKTGLRKIQTRGGKNEHSN